MKKIHQIIFLLSAFIGYNGFSATINNLEVTATDKLVSLSWAAISDTNGFYQYRVLYEDETSKNVDTVLLQAFNPLLLTEKVVQLKTYDTYSFWVEAVSKTKQVLASSIVKQLNIVDQIPPSNPIINTVQMIDSIYVTWTDLQKIEPDFKHFEIYTGTDKDNLTLLKTSVSSELLLKSYPFDVQITIGIVAVDKSNNQSEMTILSLLPHPFETESNLLFSQADTINYGVLGEIKVEDEDYFLVELSQDKGYYVDVQSLVYSSDPLLEADIFLYDKNQQLINSFIATDSVPFGEVYFQPEYTGVYYLKVKAENPNHHGFYSLTIHTISLDQYENNNTFQTATIVEVSGQTFQATAYPIHDLDVYQISAISHELIDAWVLSSVKGKLMLFDADSNLLNSREILPSSEHQLMNYPADKTGNYFMVFEADANLSNLTGTYQIQFHIWPPSVNKSLIITEINPQTNGAGFIEIYNKGTEAINLKGYFLEIETEFPFDKNFTNDYFIQAGEYIIIADDYTKFFEKYSQNADFYWEDHDMFTDDFAIVLFDSSHNVVDIVPYSLNDDWLDFKNNTNKTLEFNIEYDDNQTSEGWYLSYVEGGTPGYKNSFLSTYKADFFEPNNTKEDSKEIQLRPYQLSMSATDIVDWFQLPVDSGETYSLEFITHDKINIEVLLASKLKGDTLGITLQSIPLLAENQTKTLTYSCDSTHVLYIKIILRKDEGIYELNVKSSYAALKTPWSQKFHDTHLKGLPHHWTSLDLDSNNTTWIVQDGIGYNGTKGIINGTNSTGNNDWVITPRIALGEHDIFSFVTESDYTENTKLKEIFKVYIGDSSATYPEDFTLLATDTIANESYVLFEYDLRDYAFEHVRLAVQNISVAQGHQYIDNFSVQAAPPMGHIQGTIIDEKNTNPLQGVMVYINGKSILSNELGQYEIRDILEGNYQIKFSKTGYQSAYFNTAIKDDSLASLNVTLHPLADAQTLISQNFDNAIAQQSSWKVSEGFVYQQALILPFTTERMLVLGGSQGLGNTDIYQTWSSDTIEVNEYSSITIDFDLYKQTDSVNLQVILHDLYTGSEVLLSTFSNNTTAWAHQKIKVNDDLIIGVKNAVVYFRGKGKGTNSGFGIAIDEIKISGNKKLPLLVPTHLTASRFQKTVQLAWDIPQGDVEKYHVYKRKPQENWTIIGESIDNKFVDIPTDSLVEYIYVVTAMYPFGESVASNEAVGIIGTPHIVSISTSQSYQQDFKNGNDFWLLLNGNAEYVIPSTNKGYLQMSNQITSVKSGHYALISSPLIHITNPKDQATFEMDFIANGQDNFVFMIEKELSGIWDTLGTFQSSTTWKHLRYNFSKEASNSQYVRFALGVISSSKSLHTNEHQFAIDNVSIHEKKPAIFVGTLKYPSGKAVQNAIITNHHNSSQLTSDAQGNFITSANDFVLGDSVQFTIVKSSENISMISNWFKFDNDTIKKEIIVKPKLPIIDGINVVYLQDTSVNLSWNSLTTVVTSSNSVFEGQYNIYYGKSLANLTLIQENYTDTTIQIQHKAGDVGIYVITGLYDDGETIYSDLRQVTFTDFGFLSVKEPAVIHIPKGVMDTTVQLQIENVGEGELIYHLHYSNTDPIHGFVQELDPTIHGISQSNVYSFNAPPSKGDTVEITLGFSYLTPDPISFTSLGIQFSQGIHILDAGALKMTSGKQLSASYQKGTGEIQWINSTEQSILSGEKGVMKLKVWVDNVAILPLQFTYQLSGKSAQKTYDYQHKFTFHDWPINVEILPIASAKDSVLIGKESINRMVHITVKEHTGEVLPGVIEFISSDPNQQHTTIPFEVVLEREKYNVIGKLINSANQQVVKNAKVSLAGFETYTDTLGMFAFVGMDSVYQTEIVFEKETYQTTSQKIDVTKSMDLGTFLLKPILFSATIDSVQIVDKNIELYWTLPDTILNNWTKQEVLQYEDGNVSTISLAKNDTTTLISNLLPGNSYYYVLVLTYENGVSYSAPSDIIQIENKAPIISMADTLYLNEDESKTIKIEAIDPDGTTLTYQINATNSNVSVSTKNDSLVIIPTANWNGIASFDLIVSDGKLSSSKTIVLNVQAVNDEPILTSITNIYTIKGDTFNYQITYQDDNQNVLVNVNNLPTWLVYDSTLQTITGFVSQEADSLYSFEITLDDGTHNIVNTIELKVFDTTSKPYFTSVAHKVALVGEIYSYQLTAKDPQGNAFDFNIIKAPSWLSLNKLTNTVEGIPENNQIGIHEVIIALETSTGLKATQSYFVKVKNTNNPPSFNAMADKVFYEETPFIFVISAYDVDGDSLIFTTIKKPEWMTMTQKAKNYIEVSGTPPIDSKANYFVEIELTDGFSEVVNLPFYVEVKKSLNALNDAQYSSFKFYPNPATNQIFIENTYEASWMEIIDVQGNIVQQETLIDNLNQLNISTLNNGVYTLRIGNDEKVFVQKLIITK